MATSDPRSGNTLCSPNRTSAVTSAPHTRARTDVHRRLRLPRRQSLVDPGVRKQSRVQSILPRSRDTSGFVRSDRNRRRPAAAGESSAQACRVRSNRKSQTHRSATANPSADGTAASQRKRAAPAISTRKPSHWGSSQNHRGKNAEPTASETIAVAHRSACQRGGTLPECRFVIHASSRSNNLLAL